MKNRIKKKLSSILFSINKLLRSDNTIYLVYTMGKVGSRSVYDSLKREKPYSDVFHPHFLSDYYLDKVLPSLHEKFHYHIPIGRKIRSFISKNPKKKIKIITLTREPIERSISDLFENWDHVYSDIDRVTVPELEKRIKDLGYDYALEWFDKEFKNFLNFDIYKHRFDKEKGYQIYTQRNIDIICIKLEMLNSVKGEVFRNFLGEDISLITSNTSKEKRGWQNYLLLKNKLRIDKDELLKVYQSKYVSHFYSNEEIEKFVSRWTEN